MSEIKTPRNILIALAVVVFILHFVLQAGTLFIGFGAGMESFGEPSNVYLNQKANLFFGIFTVLSFPIVYFVSLIPYRLMPFKGPIGYLPFILNSFVWSAIFYILAKKYAKQG